jgi:hypothetical protein
MMDILKHFDTYSLKARVFPALVAGLPTFVFLFVLVPWDHLGLPHLAASAMSLVLLFAFADTARKAGKRLETRLGTGATPEQWHRGNPDVPEAAKNRYRAFVANQLRRAAPTVQEEKADPRQANDFYLSAGTWLRDNTRDKRAFVILFGENITYGYRRNLLGLKGAALVCNLIAALSCLAILILRPLYFAALPPIDEKMLMVLAAVVLHSAYMLLAVSTDGVREASRTFGRQLILSSETLMKGQSSASRKDARQTNGDH